MGTTKKHIHTEDQIALAQLFKALGHPARIAIIENLLIHENLNCNDLKYFIQLSQSTISAHLKELHDVGVLGLRTEGNNAYYVVNKVTLEQMTDYLDKTFQVMESRKFNNFFAYFRPKQNIIYRNYMNTA